jgi:hypothetical protein
MRSGSSVEKTALTADQLRAHGHCDYRYQR